LQKAQEWFGQFAGDDDYGEALGLGEAYSAIYDDEVVFCGGLFPASLGRSVAWAFISESATPCMFGVTRETKKFLDSSKLRRIETTVRSDFEEGHRWANMLGFNRECTMKSYGDDGYDYDLYARIK
jgi:hypothetical protein